jgi:hypothetical protein
VAAGGIPPEGVAARQAAEAAAEEAALAAEGGIGAKIGNALTLFGLAGSTYFGYYTYKYSAEEMEKTLDELSGQEEVPLWTQVGVRVKANTNLTCIPYLSIPTPLLTTFSIRTLSISCSVFECVPPFQAFRLFSCSAYFTFS